MAIFSFFKKKKNSTSEDITSVFERMKYNIEGKKLAEEALSHRTIGNYEIAHTLLLKSLNDYNYTPAMILIATTYIIQKKISNAINWISKCLDEIDEESDLKIELLANLGLIYLREIKDYNMALTIYNKALSIPIKSIDEEMAIILKSNIYKDIAWVHFFLKNYQEAYSYCVKRLEVVSDCDLTLKLKNHLKKHFSNAHIDVKNISVAKNKDGKSGAKVITHEDGRSTIEAGENADFLSALLSVFLVSAEHIESKHKITFSKWANLPIESWSAQHKEYFAQVNLYYFISLKNSEKLKSIKPELAKAISSISSGYKPKLNNILTKEITDIFDDLFGINE